MASRDVQVRIGTLDQYLTPQAREAILRRIAMLAIGRIKRRTGQGKDVSGKTFVAYSKGYAKRRRESGRQVTPPTLLLGGGMLGSMDILTADSERAVIGFKGSSAALKFTRRTRAVRTQNFHGGGTRTVRVATQTKSGSTHTFAETGRRISNALKARWNDQGEGRNPRRHFFGLSQEDRRELVRDALKQVIEAVRGVSFQRISSAGALRKARTSAGSGR